jgi:cytoplasmic iron level regulating protein YaaA (DUF328/UPF0246 family)
MRPLKQDNQVYQAPQLLSKTLPLARYLKTLSAREIESVMRVSSTLAVKTQALLAVWDAEVNDSFVAIDSFIGDIYSGLQAYTFTQADRMYADKHLLILSGLYGVLRPLDSICPYSDSVC